MSLAFFQDVRALLDFTDSRYTSIRTAAPPSHRPHLRASCNIYHSDINMNNFLATQHVWLVDLEHTLALHDTGGASAAPAGTLFGVERGDRQTPASTVHAADWLRMCGDETLGRYRTAPDGARPFGGMLTTNALQDSRCAFDQGGDGKLGQRKRVGLGEEKWITSGVPCDLGVPVRPSFYEDWDGAVHVCVQKN
ncbi:hypothetical protein B0H14DRAFT_269604 [Mycena olivaceomarginata]|nr:hypothetical protein B0H14DRAFT_269604 [Mycena olivaceomarginata]